MTGIDNLKPRTDRTTTAFGTSADAATCTDRPVNDLEVLWALVDGDLDPSREAEVRRHAASCSVCGPQIEKIERVHSGLASLGPADTLPLPEWIGPYRVLRLLGEGGMGVVYEAEQPEPRRRVALKVVHPTGASSEHRLRAFRREIHALGQLSHLSITAIHDAGHTTDGQLYLVMELVDGQVLDDFCEQGELTIRERVGLLAGIADAVHHAHEHGVIHRDLKPQNVLIDADRVPHVLDFGLARFVDRAVEGDVPPAAAQSVTGAPAGTLPYMSPEQLAGQQLDVRTDVYALGVMLYQLVTGRLPYDVRVGTDDALRVITDTEPPHPTAIARAVPSELGDVARMAIARERGRRYASAAALADDLRRFLDGEAVTARSPSAAYRLRVFARRHKVFAAAGAAVFAALTVGVVATSLALIEARQQREDAETVTRLLDEAFAAVDPLNAHGREILMLDLVDEISARLESEALFGSASLAEAVLRIRIAVTYRNLGGIMAFANRDPERMARAERHLRRALEIRLAVLGGEHPDTVRAAWELAATLRRWRLDPARTIERQEIFTDIVKMYRQGRVGPCYGVASSLRDAAGLFERDPEGKAAMYREAIAMFTEVQGPVCWEIAWCLDCLAFNSRNRGNLLAGLRFHEQELALARELGPRHPHVALVLGNIVTLYVTLAAHGVPHDPSVAEQYADECLQVSRALYGADHKRTNAAWRWRIDMLLFVARRPELVERECREVLAATPRHPWLELNAWSRLPQALIDQGRAREAEGPVREYAARLPDDKPETWLRCLQACVTAARGDVSAAIEQLSECHGEITRLSPSHVSRLSPSHALWKLREQWVARQLAALHEARGDSELARTWLQRASGV